MLVQWLRLEIQSRQAGLLLVVPALGQIFETRVHNPRLHRERQDRHDRRRSEADIPAN